MYEKVYTTHKVTEKRWHLNDDKYMSDKTDTWYNILILYTHER